VGKWVVTGGEGGEGGDGKCIKDAGDERMSFVFDAKLEKLLKLNGFDADVYRNAGMGFLWSEDIDCYTRESFVQCGFTPAVCDRLVQLKEFVEEYLSTHPDERRPRATEVPAALVEWAARNAAARGGNSVGAMLACLKNLG
jgi:hypothetical protein